MLLNLCSYDWSDNLRELQNGIERALILSEDGSAVSLEENLSHHSFVFVFQQVTVKQRHTTNDWISEIHNEVN
jgi:transcriptional regulator with PAS, ATPase and Fis domain